ncbi:sensor histidine kinase [Solirubrobacter soli]|uniref:sensor histidine kinase n=1 Tax=Solirubrobacter soli TaxID=363832 RepID=UPI0004085B2F|nr:ATP-binding protein [Solirubrobacter soli]
MLRARVARLTADDAASVVRGALYVAIGVGAVIDDRPGQYSATFVVALVVAFAFALVPSRLGPPWLFTAIDIVLLAVLAHASGGATSEVRFAFFAMPMLAALRYGPGMTAAVSVAVTLIYGSLALNRGDADEKAAAVEIVYLVWTAFAALVLSNVLTRREATIGELAAVRGRLMVEILDAEERERRRLAADLHDGPVQNLLVVAQDLADADRGDRDALPRARAVLRDTIPQLRTVLIDLHPGLLTASGLEASLTALAEAQGRRGGFTATVSVDALTQDRDARLLGSLARELLINVAKHARAGHAWIDVREADGGVLLEVRDDGIGLDAERRAQALADGHIGLASTAERAEALGGRFTVDGAPGQGTTVRVWIP